MNNIAIIDLKNISHSYAELQCVVGAYFRPSLLIHNSWDEIAEEIVSYCRPSCVKKIIRQIDMILDNKAIDDARLATWIRRTSTTWDADSDSEARASLRQLQKCLRKAVRRHQGRRLLTSIEHSASSFA